MLKDVETERMRVSYRLPPEGEGDAPRKGRLEGRLLLLDLDLAVCVDVEGTPHTLTLSEIDGYERWNQTDRTWEPIHRNEALGL